jgi:hypothetical protein
LIIKRRQRVKPISEDSKTENSKRKNKEFDLRFSFLMDHERLIKLPPPFVIVLYFITNVDLCCPNTSLLNAYVK